MQFKMQVSIIIAVVFLAACSKGADIDGEYLSSVIQSRLRNEKIDLPEELKNELRFQIENFDIENESGVKGIIAVVDDYADKILDNVRALIVKSGFDPMDLPGTTLKLIPVGTITLSNGTLQDTSIISRNGDVTVAYSSSTNTMSFVVPIKFESLMFSYEYLTKVLLLKIKGEAHGKVENLKIDLKLSFNYDTEHASLDHFDIANTGKFSLTFTGNGLVDWITNIMMSVVTTFLHPIIVLIIENIVKGGLESAVETINDFIDSILHHTTSSSFNQLL